MTDLHCHILPNFDDGAENPEESVELLRMEYEGGVREIALTSHFNCDRELIQDFVARRYKSYMVLKDAMKSGGVEIQGLELKLGAEVHYSAELYHMDLAPLCIEGTNFLLLELPRIMPPNFDKVVYRLQERGIVPLLAHIERYPYVMNDLSLLNSWIDRDILIQMNAESLLSGWYSTRKYIKLIQWNMIHVLASDTHSAKKRPPNLASAVRAVEKRLGKEYAFRLCRTAQQVFRGVFPEEESIDC